MKRVLAVVGAALLIAVAVVIRGVIDDDSDANAAGEDDGPADGELVVACIPELEDACNTLDVAELRIEDPAVTIADADGVDAWVTLDPWPEIASFEGAPADLTVGLGAAETPIVITARTDRLPAGCAPDWVCLAVGGNDGPMLPLPDTAFGRVAFGHAADEWRTITNAGPSLSTAEIDSPEFAQWLDGLDFGRDPLGDMFDFAPAGPLATALTSVDFETRVVGSREEGRIDSFPGALPGTVVAVVAGPAADQLRQPVLDALRDAGWEPADAGARSTGVPTAGALIALAQEVS